MPTKPVLKSYQQTMVDNVMESDPRALAHQIGAGKAAMKNALRLLECEPYMFISLRAVCLRLSGTDDGDAYDRADAALEQILQMGSEASLAWKMQATKLLPRLGSGVYADGTNAPTNDVTALQMFFTFASAHNGAAPKDKDVAAAWYAARSASQLEDERDEATRRAMYVIKQSSLKPYQQQRINGMILGQGELFDVDTPNEFDGDYEMMAMVLSTLLLGGDITTEYPAFYARLQADAELAGVFGDLIDGLDDLLPVIHEATLFAVLYDELAGIDIAEKYPAFYQALQTDGVLAESYDNARTLLVSMRDRRAEQQGE